MERNAATVEGLEERTEEHGSFEQSSRSRTREQATRHLYSFLGLEEHEKANGEEITVVDAGERLPIS